MYTLLSPMNNNISVIIQEVGLRDGLQNQSRLISAADKTALAWALLDSGLQHMEITSFVNPVAVPQMADAAIVSDALFAYAATHRPGFNPEGLSALVPNRHGLEAALHFPYKVLAVVIASTDAFNMRNLNRTTQEVLQQLSALYPLAREKHITLHTHLSGALGCPITGDVPAKNVLQLAENLLQAGATHLVVSDTIGAGSPTQTRHLLQELLHLLPVQHLSLHLHDTRGLALPIALTALELGVRRFDASVGGLGGCPFAPGATGNVATEDLVYLCHREGMPTGIDLDKLLEAIDFAEKITGQPLGGRVSRWLRSQRGTGTCQH